MNRLRERYVKEIVPNMQKKFNYKSVMQVPKLDKIVINIGCGDATHNSKLLDAACNDLLQITGQKPVVTKAKEQLVFPEIEFDDVVKVRGMDIVLVTTANTNEEAHALLEELGIPFRK